jgi:hypothetical protein
MIFETLWNVFAVIGLYEFARQVMQWILRTAAMPNKKQRMKNRETARWLREKCAPVCSNCGVRGLHWVQEPMTLEHMMLGVNPTGLWVCQREDRSE